MENVLTQLEQEVFDYLNDTPNAREARCDECNGMGELRYDVGEFYGFDQIICGACKGTGKTPAAKIETLAARISHEMDIRYSEALGIVEKWKNQNIC